VEAERFCLRILRDKKSVECGRMDPFDNNKKIKPCVKLTSEMMANLGLYVT
jgi:hypothetical protein